jgi:NTP pyrophosphatase (non-canonical NTP hydrolase)
MNIDDYQLYALKSVAHSKGSVKALAHRSLGLTGEAGIIANQIKRIIRDRDGVASDEDIAYLKEKIGDTMYYIAVLAEYFDLKLSDVLDSNKQKSDAFRESLNQG